MIDLGKKNLLGVNVNAVDYESAVDQIVESAKANSPFGVSALAVHGIMTGVMDATHRHRLNSLELIVPDGQPVRWGLNLLHRTKLAERVYGPELMLKTCEAAAERELPIFLFGSTKEILSALTKELSAKFPKLQIAGQRASQFRTINPLEKQQVVQEIKQSGAKIVFVGLGCPRQEIWAYEFKQALSMPVLAVGAAFAFHAGVLKQAPATLQKMGLEWLYRLLREPGRLWRRYLYLNPYYLALLFLQWSKLKRFDTDDTQPPSSEILYG